MTVGQLKGYIKNTIVDAVVRNVVFVGGEPLDQQKAVFVLAKWAKEEFGLKTWLYTGHEYKAVPTNIKGALDVIVSGRYDETQLAEPGAFPASTNQEVHYGR
jgi:organic radical activating enzyme